MLTLTEAVDAAHVGHVRQLIRDYSIWALTLDPNAHDHSAFNRLEQELADIETLYGPPAGSMLLAMADDQPAGCLALRGLGPTMGELKRMYVQPRF